MDARVKPAHDANKGLSNEPDRSSGPLRRGHRRRAGVRPRHHRAFCRLRRQTRDLGSRPAVCRSLGKELAGHEISVNAVTPAAAKTAIFDQMTQEHIKFMLSKIPKGRFVLVEELAAMVAWLASEECAFSTGAVFDISGGRATY